MSLGPLSSIFLKSRRYTPSGKLRNVPKYSKPTPGKGYFVTANQSVLPEFEIFTGGGGKSAGAGAGDHPILDNLNSALKQQWIRDLPSDPTYDGFRLIEEAYQNWKQQQVEQVKDEPAESAPVYTPPQEAVLDTVSPSGERESDFISDTVLPDTPSSSDDVNEPWRDFWIDTTGRKIPTRSPHTYYDGAHERDICAAVALRSHNGGKGASRAQVQAMIRAWYYCNSKRG